MTMAYETITYAAPTKRTRTINRISKLDGMEVDVLHARVFRFPDAELMDLKRERHNLGQIARVYGKKTGQKFRIEIIEHEDAKILAVWRIA